MIYNILLAIFLTVNINLYCCDIIYNGAFVINSKILLCHECDLLIENQEIAEGSKLECPRCGHVLYKQKHNTVNKTLAYTITALICFYPAVTESIMTLNMSGLSQEQSLIGGARVLLHEKYYLVAILTFMSSLLAPLLRLTLLLYVTLSLSLNYFHSSLLWSFRLYHHVEEWGMLDVYMLGIIVSVVKLLSMAEIQPGFGLWAYAVLLVTSILATTSLNHHEVWEQLLEKKNSCGATQAVNQ
ncbi:MAG: paraquat-inducible protein A [Gammaproteobacteria bacterium]|nr:paraquat-inducible protein A [Gammaproteobacteria bacterium]